MITRISDDRVVVEKEALEILCEAAYKWAEAISERGHTADAVEEATKIADVLEAVLRA